MSRFEADIAADPAAISASTERVMEFLRGAGVEARVTHHVALVLDELLSNIATHGGAPAEPTKVRITVEPQRVAGELIDSGSPFDPRSGPVPNPTASLQDREIGGLGLLLVTRLTSELDYGRRNGRNRTTFAIARE